jgi:hypothetical protein
MGCLRRSSTNFSVAVKVCSECSTAATRLAARPKEVAKFAKAVTNALEDAMIVN